VRRLIETDHRRLRCVPALEEDALRLRDDRHERQLRVRRRVCRVVEEDLLDLRVTGDDVVVEDGSIEDRPLMGREPGEHRVWIRLVLGGERVEVVVNGTALNAMGGGHVAFLLPPVRRGQGRRPADPIAAPALTVTVSRSPAPSRLLESAPQRSNLNAVYSWPDSSFFRPACPFPPTSSWTPLLVACEVSPLVASIERAVAPQPPVCLRVTNGSRGVKVCVRETVVPPPQKAAKPS
jgi:hypothetical protein